ncbi:DUF2007 domain-containing protein [Calderihabitans maritimus]|uniref:DUF2007 domain-containing protein n=1 Tax=Calderihabitans maritimus TaxID=1246530 RepID=A0A1Z5HNA6_9FIRM|nr:DUF2007 domain-containing protein [Calderihabitans maritimus]GAW91003.1 hypothetical protein KKC1_01650 [Calderihabitans maritimus]
MFCPKCKYEYVEGVKECPDCQVALVEELPPEPELEYVDLVTVLKSENPAVIMIAKSILEGAGIRYFAKGERLQDLFALGRFGSGFNPLLGPVEIRVSRDDKEMAEELLKDLK